MDKKGYNIICSWKFWLFALSISICIGVCIIFTPVLKTNEIILLASTSSQDPNQHSEPASDEGTKSNSTPEISQPDSPPVHAVTQAALKLGVLSCLKRVDQVSTFLTTDVSSGIFIFPTLEQPDQHIFSTSFELLKQDDSSLYASASFFPNNDAVYDTVQYVNKSCKELEQTVFKHLERKSVLKKNIIMLDGGAVKVFLMPAGSGTVVIKKEIMK